MASTDLPQCNNSLAGYQPHLPLPGIAPSFCSALVRTCRCEDVSVPYHSWLSIFSWSFNLSALFHWIAHRPRQPNLLMCWSCLLMVICWSPVVMLCSGLPARCWAWDVGFVCSDLLRTFVPHVSSNYFVVSLEQPVSCVCSQLLQFRHMPALAQRLAEPKLGNIGGDREINALLTS